jgi:hypothetical protein
VTKKQEALYADIQVILIALSFIALLISGLSIVSSTDPNQGFQSSLLTLVAIPSSLIMGGVGLSVTNKQIKLLKDRQSKAVTNAKWYNLYYIIVMSMPFILTSITQI